MTKTHTHSAADLSCAADFLDDIEVDESGKCEWTAVANAQTHIRAVLRCWSAAEPQSSADSEAFRDALEQLAATARTAVSYVGYANSSEREREAQSWIRKKHEELLASVLSRRTAAEPQEASVWQIGIASTTSDDVDWQQDWVTAETEEEASELAGCRGYYRNVRIRVASPPPRSWQHR